MIGHVSINNDALYYLFYIFIHQVTVVDTLPNGTSVNPNSLICKADSDPHMITFDGW